MPGAVAKQRARRSHSWIPWIVRAGVGVGYTTMVLVNEIATYGLERDGVWALGEPMSGQILVAGLVVAVPFAGLEGFFARRPGRVWVECIFAAAGSAVITWFACLPIVLRFFGSRDPIEQRWIETAATSYLIMGTAYVLLVLWFRPSQRAQRATR